MISTADMTPLERFMNQPYEARLLILIEEPEQIGLPEEASYIAQYLAQYKPLLPASQSPDNETSADIADTLLGVCPIETKVISRVMTLLGFRLYFQGVSTPVWSMWHIDNKPKE